MPMHRGLAQPQPRGGQVGPIAPGIPQQSQAGQLPWYLKMFAPQQPGLDPAMQKQMAQQAMTQMGMSMMAQSGPRPKGTGPNLAQGLGQGYMGAMQNVQKMGQQAYQNQMTQKQYELMASRQESTAEHQLKMAELQEKRLEATESAAQAAADRALKEAEMTASYREKMIGKESGADAWNRERAKAFRVMQDPNATESEKALARGAFEAIQSGFPYGSMFGGLGGQPAGQSRADRMRGIGAATTPQAPPPPGGGAPMGGGPGGGGFGQGPIGGMPNLNDPNFLAAAMQNRVGGMPTMTGAAPPGIVQPQQQSPGEYFDATGRYGGVGSVMNFMRNYAGGGMGVGPRGGGRRRGGYAGAGGTTGGGF